MINLENHKKQIDGEKERIFRLESAEIIKLEKQKEIIRSQYDKQRQYADEEYCNSIGTELYHDLQKSYNIMQTRNELTNATPEQIKRMSDFYNALSATEDENARRAIEIMSESLPETQKAILAALKTKSSLSFTPSDIYSYIAQNGADTCYLIAPVDGESNKTLTKNLEKRLGLILGECRILLGHNYDSQKGVVNEETRTKEIGFEPDEELINGFLFYSLSKIKGETPQRLLHSLTNKILELQPDGFKEAKLKHKIQELPVCAVNYFRTNDLSKYLSAKEDISEKIEETRKRNYGLNFSSTNPEERKQEALERLNVLGNDINVKDAKKILGLNHSSSTSQILKEFKSKRYIPGYNNKPIIIVSKSELKEFIQTHTPKEIRWESI